MKNWFVRTLALAAMVCVGCETTKPRPEPPQTYQGATFALSYPSSITVVNDQGEGFAVHYLRLGKSTCQMGIYEGQRPRLFSKKEKDLTIMRRGSTTRPGIDRGDDIWGVDSNALIWRESVWECQRVVRSDKGKVYRLPTMIHIWYFGASEEEAAAYDSVANTIEMLQ